MGTLQQIHRWSLTHHPRWLIVVRVALGLILFVKGISFMSNATGLVELLESSIIVKGSAWWALGITWLHLLGGFLIIIGLFTRLAVLVQIPILLGAIIFLNIQPGAFNLAYELPFALATLLLLLFFLVEGGGPLSLDNFFSKYQA
jgi:putative oxidoreductase